MVTDMTNTSNLSKIKYCILFLNYPIFFKKQFLCVWKTILTTKLYMKVISVSLAIISVTENHLRYTREINGLSIGCDGAEFIRPMPSKKLHICDVWRIERGYLGRYHDSICLPTNKN